MKYGMFYAAVMTFSFFAPACFAQNTDPGSASMTSAVSSADNATSAQQTEQTNFADTVNQAYSHLKSDTQNMATSLSNEFKSFNADLNTPQETQKTTIQKNFADIVNHAYTNLKNAGQNMATSLSNQLKSVDAQTGTSKESLEQFVNNEETRFDNATDNKQVLEQNMKTGIRNFGDKAENLFRFEKTKLMQNTDSILEKRDQELVDEYQQNAKEEKIKAETEQGILNNMQGK